MKTLKNVEDLLNRVREKTGSDYKTADALEVERQRVSGWRTRKSFPSNRHILQMCDIAEIDLREAIEAVEYSREFERPMKEAGFADVGLLAGMSLSGVTWLYFNNEFITLGTLLLPVIHYAKYDELEAANDAHYFEVYYISANYAKA